MSARRLWTRNVETTLLAVLLHERLSFLTVYLNLLGVLPRTQPTRRTKHEICYTAIMDEGRKRVLLIAASILAARKLAQYDGGKRVPATVSAISDAVRWAEEIMREIDSRWPIRKQ